MREETSSSTIQFSESLGQFHFKEAAVFVRNGDKVEHTLARTSRSTARLLRTTDRFADSCVPRGNERLSNGSLDLCTAITS